MGIGSEIFNRIVEYVERDTPVGGRSSIQLMAEKGKETFYEKRGFRIIPHEFCGSGMRKVIRKCPPFIGEGTGETRPAGKGSREADRLEAAEKRAAGKGSRKLCANHSGALLTEAGSTVYGNLGARFFAS